MNDIERIKKQTELIKGVLVELIQTFREIHTPKSKAEELYRLENKITQSIEPTQPEGYQGLNKWYLLKSGAMIYAVDETFSLKEIKGYGIDRLGKWDKDFTILGFTVVCELNASEIKEAILKGCEQNGILVGSFVKSISSGIKYKIESDECIYYKEENGLYLDGVRVFDNGKFAEVVKEEKSNKWDKLNKELDDVLNNITDEEFEEWYNKRKLNKATTDTQLKEAITELTDKELLKESVNLLKESKQIGGTAIFYYKVDEFLTKLNKHLNHE
jgi:hypothetical protein